MIYYISGKMTGEPNYREIFAKHEEYLKSKGFEVLNPVKLSDEIIEKYKFTEAEAFKEENRSIFLKEDIIALLGCDVIYMIPGWESSRGATFENLVAKTCGMNVVIGESI